MRLWQANNVNKSLELFQFTSRHVDILAALFGPPFFAAMRSIVDSGWWWKAKQRAEFLIIIAAHVPSFSLAKKCAQIATSFTPCSIISTSTFFTTRLEKKSFLMHQCQKSETRDSSNRSSSSKPSIFSICVNTNQSRSRCVKIKNAKLHSSGFQQFLNNKQSLAAKLYLESH